MNTRRPPLADAGTITEALLEEDLAGIRRVAWLEKVAEDGLEISGAAQRWHLTDRRLVIDRGAQAPGDVGLDDPKASRQHAEVVATSSDRWVVRDLGSRNGVFVDGARVREAALADGSVVRIGGTFFVHVQGEIPEGMEEPEIPAGGSLALALAEATADLAAPTGLAVLLHGPTGAGKERMAARIHAASGRRGPLVAVNCATFGGELLASELFGHTAGAFSGAKGARSGLFASADGGTLFLDEIAELPLAQQPVLLRAIQEGKIRPVGSDQELAVDVRIVAASHQDLAQLQEAGRFREDLYARLAAFVLTLPGLARRRTEILPLFRQFMGIAHKPFSVSAAEALLTHGWPQNVRELKQAAERARLFVQGAQRIELSALPPALQTQPASGSGTFEAVLTAEAPAAPPQREPGKDELEQLLARHGGNVAQVAKALGKHRQQVYRWIERHGIDVEQIRR